MITGRGTILADQPLFTIRHVTEFENSPERWIIAAGNNQFPLHGLKNVKKQVSISCMLATPEEAVEALAKAGVEMALIEAGPQLLQAFKDLGFVDEALKFIKGQK
ncbi:hypothetical protein FAI41_05075 [Acetobacteraceae bacterium]|nr:hypothetical protein FAI41_05075 [Acetobacteraceae bacterium]